MNSSNNFICFLIIALCIVSYFYVDNLHELAEVQQLRADEKALYDSEREKANKTIEEQNLQIQAFKLNLEDYREKVREQQDFIYAESLTEQQGIADELARDNSCEHQLEIMLDMVRKFTDEN